jgi:hypothetical protein
MSYIILIVGSTAAVERPIIATSTSKYMLRSLVFSPISNSTNMLGNFLRHLGIPVNLLCASTVIRRWFCQQGTSSFHLGDRMASAGANALFTLPHGDCSTSFQILYVSINQRRQGGRKSSIRMGVCRVWSLQCCSLSSASYGFVRLIVRYIAGVFRYLFGLTSSPLELARVYYAHFIVQGFLRSRQCVPHCWIFPVIFLE